MLNWKTARRGAAKDLLDVACGSPEEFDHIHPVGDQAAAFSKIFEWIDRGQRMSYRQRGDQVPVIVHEDIGHDDEAAVRTAGKRRNRIFDLGSAAHHRKYWLYAQGFRGGFDRSQIN